MPGDHRIDAKIIQGHVFLALGGRGEHPFGNIPGMAVHHGEFGTPHFECDGMGQGGHPGFLIGRDTGTGMGEPAYGQKIALRALFESAAAVVAAFAQGFLAIAHGDMATPTDDFIQGPVGIAAIGDHIACADHPASRDAEAAGFGAQGLRRLQIGIGAAEQHHRAVQGA